MCNEICRSLNTKKSVASTVNRTSYREHTKSIASTGNRTSDRGSIIGWDERFLFVLFLCSYKNNCNWRPPILNLNTYIFLQFSTKVHITSSCWTQEFVSDKRNTEKWDIFRKESKMLLEKKILLVTSIFIFSNIFFTDFIRVVKTRDCVVSGVKKLLLSKSSFSPWKKKPIEIEVKWNAVLAQ